MSADEKRHDRDLHVRREKVQRHGNRMIDRKMLGQGYVETRFHAGLPNMRRQIDG